MLSQQQQNPSLSDEDMSNYLEKALCHYREAHRYYSRFDIGPTLVYILLDMSDIYLASYTALEPRLNELAMIAKLFDTYDDKHDDITYGNDDSLSTSDDKRSTTTSIGKSSHESSTVTNIQQHNQHIIDTAISYLGGSLQAIIECKSAFTTAVVTRYDNDSFLSNPSIQSKGLMQHLALKVGQRLCKILLKILKAHSRNQLLPHTHVYDNHKTNENPLVTVYNDDIIRIRSYYYHLVKITSSTISHHNYHRLDDHQQQQLSNDIFNQLEELNKNYLIQHYLIQRQTINPEAID
jgi:hypothetical protein